MNITRAKTTEELAALLDRDRETFLMHVLVLIDINAVQAKAITRMRELTADVVKLIADERGHGPT